MGVNEGRRIAEKLPQGFNKMIRSMLSIGPEEVEAAPEPSQDDLEQPVVVVERESEGK